MKEDKGGTMKVRFKLSNEQGRMHHELSFDLLDELKYHLRNRIREKAVSPVFSEINQDCSFYNCDLLLKSFEEQIAEKEGQIVYELLQLQPDDRVEMELSSYFYDDDTFSIPFEYSDLLLCFEPIAERAAQELRYAEGIETLHLQDGELPLNVFEELVPGKGETELPIVSACCNAIIDRLLDYEGWKNARARRR